MKFSILASTVALLTISLVDSSTPTTRDPNDGFRYGGVNFHLYAVVSNQHCDPEFGVESKEKGLLGGFHSESCENPDVKTIIDMLSVPRRLVVGVTKQLVAGTKYAVHTKFGRYCCVLVAYKRLDDTMKILMDEICCRKGTCSPNLKTCEDMKPE